MGKKLAAGIAAPVLALSLSACGMLGGNDGSAPDQSGSQANSQGAPAVQNQGTAPPQNGEIATKTVKSGEAELEVKITSLKRQGKLAVINWTITNKSDAIYHMSDDLGDTPAGMGLTVAGVSLVDPEGAKRYRVARNGSKTDSELDCVCSEYINTLQGGEGGDLSATFAAPPPTVKKVNVDLRSLGVFTDVPIA